MASWTNATAARTASSKGVLWPVETVDAASLRNTYPVAAPAYLDLLGTLAEMLHDRSLTTVHAVAERAGLTDRSLQRLFRHYLGVSPKWALRRYRLQDAAALIDSGQAGDLKALANELGWFDQSHFCRDFRSAVGRTPTTYAARPRPLPEANRSAPPPRLREGDLPSPTDTASG